MDKEKTKWILLREGIILLLIFVMKYIAKSFIWNKVKKEQKMRIQNPRLIILVLMGALCLIVSSVYAETAEEYFTRGFAAYNQGNLPQAIADYTKAIAINSNYAAAYYNRGFTYFMIKDYGKAWLDVYEAEGLGMTINSEFLTALKEASGRNK